MCPYRRLSAFLESLRRTRFMQGGGAHTGGAGKEHKEHVSTPGPNHPDIVDGLREVSATSLSPMP